MEFKVVIPARYASVRLPGKPLLKIAGKPMIQHVHERALESGANEVVIATDDADGSTAAPLTIARISTDDVNGTCKAYVAEGRFLDDPLDTFGSRAVVEIPNFQPLLKLICNVGFEHHCAMSPAHTADAVAEEV